MLNKKHIKLNCSFKDKFDIFQTIENDLIALKSVKKGYYKSMIERDEISSVALGNYLFLPHSKGGDDHLIINNSILVYHLKETMTIDDKKIKIIIALSLKRNCQMEQIEKIGITFSDEDEIVKILFNQNVSVEEIYNLLTT